MVSMVGGRQYFIYLVSQESVYVFHDNHSKEHIKFVINRILFYGVK